MKSKFSFKVISVGSFVQLMLDKATILNRPCINVDDKKIRYGNEYLLYDKKYDGCIEGKTFLGTFAIDKKNNINLKLFGEIDVPISPDYYILTVNHEGDRFDKSYDIIRANSGSYSKIFSTAYYEEDGKFKCQTILILQHADLIVLNGKKKLFSAKSESLL